ncbi:LON peptidase substrate-binding domain-containing protein [Luteimonas sp. RIT-PG2_3]
MEVPVNQSLPLFPLQTVLVPGGALGLRVFEARYLDLVRDCGRHGHGFGVCMIVEGREAGQPAVPAAFGTEALIEDFDTGPDGLLHLRVRGARRFHVERTRVRDNGLIVADVRWCAPDPTVELQPQHALLGEVLARIIEQIDTLDIDATRQQLDDAAWVGWRLAELLPLTLAQRQALLQEDDPDLRLDALVGLID